MVSDDPSYHRILKGLCRDFVTYTFADIFAGQHRHYEMKTTHLWLDLPQGKRWRATKTDGLLKKLKDFYEERMGEGEIAQPILLAVPWGNDRRRKFAYKRWSKLLAWWRPHSATYCSCQLLDQSYSERHMKMRVFATLRRSPPLVTC